MQQALDEGFDINKYGALLDPKIHGGPHGKFSESEYVDQYIKDNYYGGSAKKFIEDIVIPHIETIVKKAKANKKSLDKVVEKL